MTGNLKNWRDSATLLLVAKQTFLESKTPKRINYKIMTMKRSSRSSFMPDTHVFPGGTLDKADCSRDWLKLYKKFGINDQHFDIFKKVKYVAPIFKNEIENTISKFISLRICAIREAFEECGVLLCKSSKQENKGNASLWASYFGGIEVNEWQKRVHNDASQFIEMCDKFEIYPDIWALHEWSNWLTPSGMGKRFDTIFFLANVQNTLNTFAEKKEVQHIQWDSPTELLQKNEKLEIFLPPPQYYELSRLMNFQNVEELAEFSMNRSLNGTERFLPYRLATDKIQTTILPGDDLYPGVDQAQIPNEDVMDDIPEKNTVHRMYHLDTFKNKITIKNYKYETDHVHPVITKDRYGNSKL